MPDGYSRDAIIVSDSSFDSDEAYDILYSNIAFLNAQFKEHLTPDEVSANALRSYYVDYYLAQVNNGGFSQFVYNSGWEVHTIRLLSEGLAAIGAARHLELFSQAAEVVNTIGLERLEAFFESDYFGENEERDILNKYDDRFFALSDEENLIELNAAWLHEHPDLIVIPVDEIEAEVRRRSEAIPDRAARSAAARANEPRSQQLIRALCEVAGQELDCVTAGDPNYEYNGQRMVAWHFLTDKGHHYMVDADGKAFMCKGDSDERICEIDAPAKLESSIDS